MGERVTRVRLERWAEARPFFRLWPESYTTTIREGPANKVEQIWPCKAEQQGCDVE